MPVVRSRHKTLGRKLSYFGMPGPEIKDLLEWKDYLSRIRTGVELNRTGLQGETDRNNQRLILNNVMAQSEPSFSSGFELRKGEVEDLILRGIDHDGVKPQLGDGYVDGNFGYDLVNLDFCGGFGYRDAKGHTKRVKAIRKLAERQQNTSFILFLTLNVRDKMGDELETYLKAAQKRYHHNRILVEDLTWHFSQGAGHQACLLKAAVPMFIQQEFEIFGFRVLSYPPLVYEGTGQGSKLVNFMFEAEHIAGSNLPVFSEQQISDLIGLPMIEVAEGRIRLAQLQAPHFAPERCIDHLGFLPGQIAKQIENSQNRIS